MYDWNKEKDILLIKFDDFKISNQTVAEETIILFIDKNGETKILKNRLGDNGNGRFKRLVESMKQNSADNELGYGPEYFDQVINLIS